MRCLALHPCNWCMWLFVWIGTAVMCCLRSHQMHLETTHELRGNLMKGLKNRVMPAIGSAVVVPTRTSDITELLATTNPPEETCASR
mmetsp:Transcript_13974/g.33229  ORF Transcript_13974/g.33229 Transcript_13974/m.33229 type:complete len:87 (-) Transcript_13974:3-263(-)